MARILITGGAGFIGSNCANTLSGKGHEVIAIDNLLLGTPLHLNPEVTFVEGDVSVPSVLDTLPSVDYVIHLAGASTAPLFTDDLIGSFKNNILGHLQVLEFARTHGVKKVLYASTSSIYGNNPVPLSEDQSVRPPNFYSVSKHTQEEVSHVYHEQFGLEIIGFRFMSVYGLHEEHKGKFANLVSQFIWGLEQEKEPVLYGDGTQMRDFVNVKDVVSAFELALSIEKLFGSTIFNVGTTRAVSLSELIQIIGVAMGKEVTGKYIPNPIARGYVMSQQADLTKIERELGYTPTISLEDGVREIVAYKDKRKINPTSLSF